MPYRSSVGAKELRHEKGAAVEAHRHAHSYLAVVLDGAYEEVSADGRFFCEAGALIVHPAYHAHANTIDRDGARTLNFLLPPIAEFQSYSVYSSPDAAELARLARRSPAEAAQMVFVLRKSPVEALGAPDWCLALAACLKGGERSFCPPVSREHASRKFRRHFGMSPSEFRAEWRLRRVLEMVRFGQPLAEAAHAAGYSDQSHMSREVRRATGITPSRHRSETDGLRPRECE